MFNFPLLVLFFLLVILFIFLNKKVLYMLQLLYVCIYMLHQIHFTMITFQITIKSNKRNIILQIEVSI